MFIIRKLAHPILPYLLLVLVAGYLGSFLSDSYVRSKIENQLSIDFTHFKIVYILIFSIFYYRVFCFLKKLNHTN